VRQQLGNRDLAEPGVVDLRVIASGVVDVLTDWVVDPMRYCV